MSDGFSESTLIQHAVEGDRVALSQLLLNHYADLQRQIAHQLSQQAIELVSSEDILQQTFVRAALGIAHFEPRANGSFRAWLATIAGNLVRDAQKRRRRERRAAPPQENLAADESCVSGLAGRGIDRLARDSTSPSMRVHKRDNAQRMREALECLPPEQREVIQRHYLQHQSLDQIAAAMHRSKDAVRGINHRARRALRSLLGHSSRFFTT
jgi:RNA polymerase sigma-70 factor (ECF subfamily)